MSDNLNKLLSEIVIIDTESTGLDFEKEDIVEMGYCFWDSESNDFEEVSRLYGSRTPISFSASAINNISRRMIKGLPLFKDNLDEVKGIIDQFTYIVSHNVEYDHKIMNANFKRGGMDVDDFNVGYKGKWICTLRLARRLLLDKDVPEGEEAMRFGLNFLRYYFDLDETMNEDKIYANHRAGNDAYICGHLLLRLIEVGVKDGVIDLNKDLGQQLLSLTWDPIPITTWPYGKKWKGSKMEEIPESYFLWAIDNLDELNEKSYRYNDDVAQAVISEVNKRLEAQNG